MSPKPAYAFAPAPVADTPTYAAASVSGAVQDADLAVAVETTPVPAHVALTAIVAASTSDEATTSNINFDFIPRTLGVEFTSAPA